MSERIQRDRRGPGSCPAFSAENLSANPSVRPNQARKAHEGGQTLADSIFSLLRITICSGFFMVGTSAWAGVPPISVVNAPYFDRTVEKLVRLNDEVAIPIEYAGDVFDVGDSLLLFDVSQKYYVALVNDGDPRRGDRMKPRLQGCAGREME